jgi:fluoroquinolone transport system ATP-binding protein
MTILHVEQLTFTYPTQTQPTLTDVSITLNHGEIVGLLGPSGAGKSTTQKILLKLLHGYTGQVSVLGKSLAAWGQDYYRHIGVSFELPNHYPKLTAWENMHVFAKLHGADPARIMPLLEHVGLASDAHRRVAQFSKGMQMRLLLVRALLHQPQLLFLDEPTSGLDPNNAQRMVAMIRDYRDAGNAVFLTTHDMHVASILCDRVAFMVGGRLAVCAPPHELMYAHGTRMMKMTYISPESPNQAQQYEVALDSLASDVTFQTLVRTCRIVDIHSQEASLADVFTQVTGEVLT